MKITNLCIFHKLCKIDSILNILHVTLLSSPNKPIIERLFQFSENKIIQKKFLNLKLTAVGRSYFSNADQLVGLGTLKLRHKRFRTFWGPFRKQIKQ